jgi:hypothetical protein
VVLASETPLQVRGCFAKSKRPKRKRNRQIAGGQQRARRAWTHAPPPREHARGRRGIGEQPWVRGANGRARETCVWKCARRCLS